MYENFTGAETVFLADVRAVDGTFVSFDVREAFKNARRGAVTLRIASTYGSHSFRPEERVLVFASRGRIPVPGSVSVDGRLEYEENVLTTMCSHSRKVANDDPDIRILRHLARRDPGGTVEGVLARFDSRWLRYPGVRIALRPVARSGRVQRTVTGPVGGGYRFDWVAPGNYIVLLEGPPGVKDQQRLIHVAADQRILRVPAFIISAEEHVLLAPPEYGAFRVRAEAYCQARDCMPGAKPWSVYWLSSLAGGGG